MKSLAALLILASAAAAVHAADTSKSVALVRAMRSDEIAVASAKLRFLNGDLVERYGKTNASCVKRIPYADFTVGWSRVIDTVLDAKEIDSSLAFFQSDAGVKYVEGLLRRMRSREGADAVFPEVPGKEDISAAQQAAIADFSRSDLGRKVMGKDLLLSPAAQASGRDILDQISRKCGGK